MILYEVYDSQSILTTLPILFTVRSYIENIVQQPTIFWGHCVPLLVFLIVFGIGVSRALGTAKRFFLYETIDYEDRCRPPLPVFLRALLLLLLFLLLFTVLAAWVLTWATEHGVLRDRTWASIPGCNHKKAEASENAE
jgi:hypothetical protein